MDVFNKLRELLKSDNRTLLRCGLELMSTLGHLLDGVVDIELKSNADDSVSSDSMGEDIVKAGFEVLVSCKQNIVVVRTQ